jgi:hypothetical protein
VRVCPDCQRELTFVCSWTFRDQWGYTEVSTYECSTHGPIFVGPQAPVAHDVHAAVPDNGPDGSDRDSLTLAVRKPKPTSGADAIAVPEPHADGERRGSS